MRLRLLVGAIGFVSAGIGVGGGAILVPTLIHWGQYDFRRASSLSLVTIVPISFVGAIAHLMLLGEPFPLHLLVAFIPAGAVGVFLGGASLRQMSTRWLTTAFGFFLCIVGFKMLTGWNLASYSLAALEGHLLSYRMMLLVLFGIGVGATSSLLGVGCGLVIVPFCVYVLGFSMHVAIPFSLVSMFFLSSTGTWERYRRGLLNLPTAMGLLPAALGGAIVGAASSTLLPEVVLRQAFGAFLLLMGIKHLGEEMMRLLVKSTEEIQHADAHD